VNYLPVIMMLCLSIGCGYATAKYVVQPVVNYVPQITAEKETTEEPSEPEQKAETQAASETAKETTEAETVVEGDAAVEQTGKISGYALQFGCYSSKAAAEKAKGSIEVSGLQILKQNQMYKIISQSYDSKNKAEAARDALPEDVDAFITPIYEQ